MPEELWRGTPEHEEARRSARTIGEDPQDSEEVGSALHFVEDDQATQRAEGELRLVEAGEIVGILQVKVVGRPIPGFRHLPGERCLSDLSRPGPPGAERGCWGRSTG